MAVSFTFLISFNDLTLSHTTGRGAGGAGTRFLQRTVFGGNKKKPLTFAKLQKVPAHLKPNSGSHKRRTIVAFLAESISVFREAALALNVSLSLPLECVYIQANKTHPEKALSPFHL